jgi:hypothetical protein
MEQALLNVAQIFTGEINKLESRKAGTDLIIELQVRIPNKYDDSRKPSVNLEARFYNGSNYETLKAASLGALMDEVYHRAGFADKEAVKLDRVEASLVALPSPQEFDENGMYKKND